MSEFAATTAFRLVRRLVLGTGNPAMYLLICDEEAMSAVEADLLAEIAVQMATPLRAVPVLDILSAADSGSILAARIDRWSAELVPLLDTHVTRLERTGAQFLFLTTPALAERLLVNAPNFRNRITEVIRIIPDNFTGGVDPRVSLEDELMQLARERDALSHAHLSQMSIESPATLLRQLRSYLAERTDHGTLKKSYDAPLLKNLDDERKELVCEEIEFKSDLMLTFYIRLRPEGYGWLVQQFKFHLKQVSGANLVKVHLNDRAAAMTR